MIGIVVVSHSRALGVAAAQLAAEMVPVEAQPQMEVAAGLDETTFGTDAVAIADAITAVDSPEGVLVLVDLGSAILSSQMALEFIDPDLAKRTKISAAPLVEGLIAALVTAGTGASLDEVGSEASRALLGKQDQVGDDQPAEPSVAVNQDQAGLVFSWTIRNPHGLHARPAATLVAGLRGIDATVSIRNATLGKGPVPANSLTGIQTLGLRKSDKMEAWINGPQAELAQARLTEMAQDDFGEGDERKPVDHPVVRPGLIDPTRTGHQIVIGPARHLEIDPDTSAYRTGEIAGELARLDTAVTAVAAVFKKSDSGMSADIKAVQELILTDESTMNQLQESIEGGRSAVDAVRDHFTAAAGQLEELDDVYLRARAEDQRGVERMLLRALTNQPIQPGLADGILILDELDPLIAGMLDTDHCQGIITISGGATGHGALIAEARGFALLTGQTEAAAVPEGTTIAIDPVAEQLWINPSIEQIEALKTNQAARLAEMNEAARLSRDPAITLSGKRILVEANISCVQEALDAKQAGADGSGIVRTEVLFGNWNQAPSIEEQAEVYTQIGQALDGQMVTIRTWDPGGDKPIVFLPQDPEVNPMLGERGIRVMRRLPHLLDEQLTAVLLASRQVSIRVMLPMITLPESMVWARQRLDGIQRKVGGQVSFGMMVETPAAALRAADFLDLADFISIGTNDLTQYTLAVDRGNPKVAQIVHGDNAAVWDLIGIAARVFTGRSVAVCGDLASQPDAVARLITLGVNELSVRPPLVGIIKQAVRVSA